MRSYFEATESKTDLTRVSLTSVGTVLYPKEVVSDGEEDVGGVCTKRIEEARERCCKRETSLLQRCILLVGGKEEMMRNS